MEGGNSGQAPCLPTLAFGFGPDNRLPIRCQDQACSWATDLDTMAAWLHNVEEDSLLNGMLVWAVLDTVPELNGNIRSAEDFLTSVYRVADMVEASPCTCLVLGNSDFIALIVSCDPGTLF